MWSRIWNQIGVKQWWTAAWISIRTVMSVISWMHIYPIYLNSKNKRREKKGRVIHLQIEEETVSKSVWQPDHESNLCKTYRLDRSVSGYWVYSAVQTAQTKVMWIPKLARNKNWTELTFGGNQVWEHSKGRGSCLPLCSHRYKQKSNRLNYKVFFPIYLLGFFTIFIGLKPCLNSFLFIHFLLVL